MGFDYPARMTRLRAALGDQGIDAVLLSVGPDLPYFTGYEAMPSERLTVLVVGPDVEPVLFVPELEAPRVVPGLFEIRPWGETEDPIALACSRLTMPAQLAIGDHTWSAFLTRFLAELPGCRWLPASGLTGPMRMIKDDAEIELLRSAATGVDQVMGRIPAELAMGGRTEAEVARDLAGMTVDAGHDSADFTIVASGPNAASPHHHPGERVIEEGDLVVCDFGGRWEGYYSDSTRTFVVGEPTSEQAEVHAAVLAANRAGREAVRAGIACEDVDRTARAVIEEAGYGDYFVHRTGHGIGLEVHEHPYMVEGNDTLLESGMAFSVEPGVYLPGRLGVRIEDIVICAGDGGESLNRSDRALLSVA